MRDSEPGLSTCCCTLSKAEVTEVGEVMSHSNVWILLDEEEDEEGP